MSEIKAILSKLVDELETLTASQAVLGRYVPSPPTIAEAREAKGLALQENRAHFDKLRKQIEGLA
jgi:hypothetical protein